MKNWLRAHREALGVAGRRLAGTPVSSLLGALVIGIALALPAGGEMVLANLSRLAQNNAAAPQLSLFMAMEAGRKETGEVEARLRRHEDVREVRLVGREETLKRFKSDAAMGDVIDSLPRNPFPDTFVVIPRSNRPEAMERLRAEFARYPKVEHAQLDSAWASRLDAFLRLGRLAATFLAGLLGIALVAVTFSTIRLQVLTHGAEIELSRLLGATDAFIRRPFYYFGALQGLAGGIVAWLIVRAGTYLIDTPASSLAALYAIPFRVAPLPGSESAALLGVATLLGWLGAQLSVSRHLRAK